MKYKHTLWGVGLSLLFSWGMLSASAAAPAGEETTAKETFEVGKGTFLLNGKPFVVKAAEVHYPRIPEPYWEQRILSCKALGMNTLACMYSGTCMNSIRVSSISQVTRTLPNSAAWHRNTECMSSCVRDRTFVRNGKWADCLGGC